VTGTERGQDRALELSVHFVGGDHGFICIGGNRDDPLTVATGDARGGAAKRDRRNLFEWHTGALRRRDPERQQVGDCVPLGLGEADVDRNFLTVTLKPLDLGSEERTPHLVGQVVEGDVQGARLRAQIELEFLLTEIVSGQDVEDTCKALQLEGYISRGEVERLRVVGRELYCNGFSDPKEVRCNGERANPGQLRQLLTPRGLEL
jgi:hypothetical protein